MSSADYVFRTEWRVAGTLSEVRDVLSDPAALPVWWPSVYLAVEVLSDHGPDGQGAEVRLHTKGLLPYTLVWVLRVPEPATDTGFSLTAEGDLEGEGTWTFRQDGPEAVIVYDWRVRASKPLLRRLSWLLKPVFAANHRWAMDRGEQSLALELRRRRATTPEERAAVPAPPGPTWP